MRILAMAGLLTACFSGLGFSVAVEEPVFHRCHEGTAS
jgi:hypothetical protein